MKINDTVSRHKKTLLDIIHKHLPKCKVYLFGSRATKENREGADIDLALDTGEKVDLTKVARIQIDIEETTFPLFVDLVDLHLVSEDFKKNVLSEGIEWKS